MAYDRNERRPRDQQPTNMSEETSESTPPGYAEKDLDAGDESMPGAQDRLEDLLGYARAHAATGDTRVWVDDLEQMLSVAWDLMTPDQRLQFREHPDTAALIEAAGDSPLPP
jgi:hypothetical protein